jgi:glycosyltransferase involved in cell wall biosynthesis
MRILLITGSYPTDLMGGAEMQTLVLANGLIEYGYDVTFLASDADEESKSHINNLCVVKIPGIDMVGEKSHKQYLEKEILEARPDLCYVRSFSEFMWAIPFCKNNGIKVISVCSSGLEASPFPIRFSLREHAARIINKEIIRQFLNFRSIRFSDMHICVSKSLRESMKQWYPDIPIREIYDGHQLPSAEEFHKDYSKRIIWVNNIKRLKRPEIYIKLASCLPDIEFAMIGRIGNVGRYNHYVRSLISHGPNNLKYFGPLPFVDVNKEISMSDILMYTSRQVEGFPNSLFQAWMRCVPTISLNFDPDGVIERERIGRCPHNFSQLVKETRKLIDNPLMLRDMGQRARMYAEVNHDCKNMVSQYDKLFREIINRRSK